MEENKENVLLLKEKDFLKWKRAYKNCKKYRSKAIKDSYDEFVSCLKKDYKRYIKGKTSISFFDLTNFFNLVFHDADEYLKLDKKKKSKFYFAKREEAVENLKKESEKMNTILYKKKLDNETKAKEDQENFVKKQLNGWIDFLIEKYGYNIDIDNSRVSISSGIENCAFYIVADVPYMKFDITTFRIYFVVTGRSSGSYRLEKLFSNFSFKEYNLLCASGNTILNYRDKDFKSRKIFKACEVPIKANANDIPILKSIIGNIDLKAEVYVSPNDLISKFAFKHGNININGVKLEKILLTESEL